MKILAVICARAGSRRIPNKNMKELGGKSLIRWAVNAYKESSLIDLCLISSDSVEYCNHAQDYGIGAALRPKDISGDSNDIKEATRHALECAESSTGIEFDYVVTLQAAVPLRPAGAIDALIKEMIASGARGGLSMVPRSNWMWSFREGRACSWWNKNHYPRSQTINWRYFEEVNAIQIAPASVVRAGKRWSFPLAVVELPAWCSVDIDEEADLAEAREYVELIKPLLDQPREFKTYTVNT